MLSLFKKKSPATPQSTPKVVPLKPKAIKPKKKRAPRRDFGQVYPGHYVIKVITAINPKRPGTKAHEMFNEYYKSKDVTEALINGVTYRQIDYDVQHEFIEVVPK